MASAPIQALLKHGVVIPAPDTVHVADDVSPDAIAPGVVLHPGTRILGAATRIGPGCVIGEEAPMTVDNCQLGHGVALKGGYASGAVFLDGANAGSASHLRPATLFEEEASAAHAVGTKQTILLPFVTLGSLINFCDVLMAGGTSRKDHSEVGSSYIHFNYTPHQDKATASLVGDVPRGVLLDQRPIFLGGQGGLVGPSRVDFGNVVPAGVVWRGDSPGPDTLLRPPPDAGGCRPYDPTKFGQVDRILRNNLLFLGNLHALKAWYLVARSARMAADPWRKACYEGALRVLADSLKERIKRLGELAGKLPQGHGFVAAWPNVEASLKAGPAQGVGASDRSAVAAWAVASAGEPDHAKAVKAMPAETKAAATRWLQAMVDSVASFWHPAGP